MAAWEVLVSTGLLKHSTVEGWKTPSRATAGETPCAGERLQKRANRSGEGMLEPGARAEAQAWARRGHRQAFGSAFDLEAPCRVGWDADDHHPVMALVRSTQYPGVESPRD